MMLPTPPLLATSDLYHYQQQQPPPLLPSRPPVLHQQQEVWYSNQNQYQSLQPPSPLQQWVWPPHANHLPPSLGYYHPPPPPHYAHHYYPQSLSHGPPQSYYPQQLNREWAAQSPPRLVQQKSGTGLAEMGPEINSFYSSGSSSIMTMGSFQVQLIGCLSTMVEFEIEGIEVPIGVSLENGFDQISRDVELQSEYDKVVVAEIGDVELKTDVVGADGVDFWEREEKELEAKDCEVVDDDDKDDERENDNMIFRNFVPAKQLLEELERESDTGSYSSAESYGDRSLSYGDDSQRVDRQIMSGFGKEVNTNERFWE
ncbi:hypothetical protein RchiOBHm_Chr5g0070121 [Rosa chinensis]|uniref:Uncharacterized protein n=1 Tax=Rosa chinensis TaxID=74649 RepID=A0A2P6QK36_ROSCH|nr:hypothetical protein RchiOBHm_Chr5g0070121 [Rosa chinensis]